IDVTSILPIKTVLTRNPPLAPPLDLISFASYAAVWQRKPLLTWLENSAIVTSGSGIISPVVATMAAYSLSRFKTFGRQAPGLIMLGSKMLPSSLIVIPFFIM